MIIYNLLSFCCPNVRCSVEHSKNNSTTEQVKRTNELKKNILRTNGEEPINSDEQGVRVAHQTVNKFIFRFLPFKMHFNIMMFRFCIPEI